MADVNTFDYFRRGEPVSAIQGTSGTTTFDYYRRGEPALVIISGAITEEVELTLSKVLATLQSGETSSEASLNLGMVRVVSELSEVAAQAMVTVDKLLSVAQEAQSNTQASLNISSAFLIGTSAQAEAGGTIVLDKLSGFILSGQSDSQGLIGLTLTLSTIDSAQVQSYANLSLSQSQAVSYICQVAAQAGINLSILEVITISASVVLLVIELPLDRKVKVARENRVFPVYHEDRILEVL